jgi:hypothetical protein
MRAAALSFAFAFLAVCLAACGGALSEGKCEFEQGNYPQAKQTLAVLENESRTWDDARRAEYALYRGLTLFALADRQRATAWLREAKALEDAHPGALSPADERRLSVALDSGLGP